MENQEQNDPTWDLLKHASETKPSAFFARNVVREVRLLEDSETGFAARLRFFLTSPRSLIGAAAAAALAVGIFASSPNRSAVSEVPPIAQSEAAEESTFDPTFEMEEVEYLGQLMAVADPGQLTDEAIADLFF